MHLYLKGASLTLCPKCAKPVLPHIVCQNCGYYKGMEMIDVLKKLTKKERKRKEKELAAKEAGEKKPASVKDTAGKEGLNWERMSQSR